MAKYPPPPPGGGYGPAAYAYDPYAADRALGDWLDKKGYTLTRSPDVRWYHAWYPFQFMFPVATAIREIHAEFDGASAHIIEGLEGNAIKAATGEDRHVYAFVTSDRLAYRSAIKSRHGGSGIIEDVSKGLESLLGNSGPQPGALLGDPTFESSYEVLVPSRDEGNLALTMPLRQLLVARGFVGILELRKGGLAMLSYPLRTFHLPTLRVFVALLREVVEAATKTPAVVTPPPKS